MRNKIILVFVLLFTVTVLAGCSHEFDNVPTLHRNINSTWVCKEYDAFFTVDERQQCYGEINYGTNNYQLFFSFSGRAGFLAPGFAAYCIEDVDPQKGYRPMDYVLVGTAKYYEDRCVLIIKKEDNLLWEMQEREIEMTFFVQ